jgi:hypothetical protein
MKSPQSFLAVVWLRLPTADVPLTLGSWPQLQQLLTNSSQVHSCCWFLPAQSFLVSSPSGPVTIFLPFCRLLSVLEWDLHFEERRGLTATGHSLSAGEWLLALSLSLTPLNNSDWLKSTSKSELLCNWRFTANQFILASSLLRRSEIFFNWTLAVLILM